MREVKNMNRTNWASCVLVLSAWVLWSETFPPLGQKPGNEDWRILDAYDSRPECVRNRTKFIAATAPDYREKNPQTQIVTTEKEILLQKDHKTSVTITFHCLPESVDPRPR